MTAEPETPHRPPKPPASKARQIAVVSLRVLLILGLLFETLHSMGWEPPWLEDACGLKEASQGDLSAHLYNTLARWGLHHTASPYVAIVHVGRDTNPPEVLTNTCASRSFLSDLIPALIQLRATVIAVDKYYASPCTTPGVDERLKQVLRSSPIPIVLGLQTQSISNAGSKSEGEGCLALAPRLDLSGGSPTSNLRFGLTRLNMDILQIPLQWPVFYDPGVAGDPNNPPSAALGCLPAGTAPPKTVQACSAPGCGDGLALVAAQAYDRNIKAVDGSQIQSLIDRRIHPYTSLVALPTVDAMTALCTAEHRANSSGTSWRCTAPLPTAAGNSSDSAAADLIAGKVVIIGDVAPGQDVHGNMPGVDLQANYVESLLEQRFLRPVPDSVVLIFLILFAIAVYGMYWLKILDHDKAPVRSVMLYCALVLVSLAALMGFSLYTPVWALVGGLLFLVARYMDKSGEILFGGHEEGHEGSGR